MDNKNITERESLTNTNSALVQPGKGTNLLEISTRSLTEIAFVRMLHLNYLEGMRCASILHPIQSVTIIDGQTNNDIIQYDPKQ